MGTPRKGAMVNATPTDMASAVAAQVLAAQTMHAAEEASSANGKPGSPASPKIKLSASAISVEQSSPTADEGAVNAVAVVAAPPRAVVGDDEPPASAEARAAEARKEKARLAIAAATMEFVQLYGHVPDLGAVAAAASAPPAGAMPGALPGQRDFAL